MLLALPWVMQHVLCTSEPCLGAILNVWWPDASAIWHGTLCCKARHLGDVQAGGVDHEVAQQAQLWSKLAVLLQQHLEDGRVVLAAISEAGNVPVRPYLTDANVCDRCKRMYMQCWTLQPCTARWVVTCASRQMRRL